MGGVGVEAHLEALVQNINGGPESAQEYGMRWLDILLQVGVVWLCSVRIVQFYKVARARMLNLGIHRLAYLLFLMVVLNLFWTTNFPCKIFRRHPLGFVKIDFEPPDISPLSIVLWGHPLRHSWKQEKKKTA